MYIYIYYCVYTPFPMAYVNADVMHYIKTSSFN